MSVTIEKVSIERVDYRNQEQAKDLVYLLNRYAKDPMGGGRPLDGTVQKNLVAELAKLPHAFSLMAYVDSAAAGLVNCFEGFSTFKAKPLINIHDIVVLKQYRGIGISQKLLAEVERIAKEKSCCKLTLEVLDGNVTAQGAYRKFGFEGYELDPVMGQAKFWQKTL